MKARDYQSSVIDGVLSAWAAGQRRVLARIPTGGGKTFIAGDLIEKTPGPVVFMAHRRNLIEQASRHLDDVGIRHGIIAPGYPMNGARVRVASVETLVRRLNRVDPAALIVTDEAHHAVCGSYRRIYDWSPDALHLGLTATPKRLDGQGLGDLFDVIVEGPTTGELIGRGFLSPFRAWGIATADDIDPENMTEEEIGELMDRPRITGDAVEHYRRHAEGLPALAFCSTIKHAEHVAESFQAAGYRSRALHSGLDPFLVDEYLRRLREGDIDVLTNCGMIDEGTDVPGVSAMIDLAPTDSLSRFLQRCGRVLRPVYGDGSKNSEPERIASIARGPKPWAVILDHAGNIDRHGLPDAPREWGLDGKVATPGATLKRCPGCYAMVPIGSSTCPECGEAFGTGQARRLPEAGEGDLVEIGGVPRLLYDAIREGGWSLVQARGIATVLGHRPELGERVFFEVFHR